MSICDWSIGEVVLKFAYIFRVAVRVPWSVVPPDATILSEVLRWFALNETVRLYWLLIRTGVVVAM